MRYFCLDSGTYQTGYCDFVSELSAPEGRRGKEKNETVLEMVLAGEYDELVLEDMNSWGGRGLGATTRTTLIWIGRFVQAAVSVGKKYHLLPRDEVKAILGLKRTCKDAIINAHVQQLFVPDFNRFKNPGILKGFALDSWSALAVGLAYCVKGNLLK